MLNFQVGKYQYLVVVDSAIYVKISNNYRSDVPHTKGLFPL